MEPAVNAEGLMDVRYAAFLETVSHVRANLHLYCARMAGSVIDGEDIMQEALLDAYRKMHLLDDPSSLRPWLFRIAHNRCIDFLRKRKSHKRAEESLERDEFVQPAENWQTRHAIERLVAFLPPKERACILLKDVLDHSLEEVAELVDSTIGGVKSALNRARAKLARIPVDGRPLVAKSENPELTRLLGQYVDLFNRRDWEGVRALTSADARLRVSDCYNGRLADSPYFTEYERAVLPWRLDIGEVDGETLLVASTPVEGRWVPAYPVRISVSGGHICRIEDYYACPWIFDAAGSVRLAT